MSKYSGVIGYALCQETEPGVWTDSIIEKKIYGDLVKDSRRLVDNNLINDNVIISNNISIVCNKFMLENLAFIKYITYMNSKWKVSNVEIKPPRLIITLGGLYNE
jgi:hypothetical protein